MSWLSLLLIIKICVTGIVVAAPFMLLPKLKLEKLTNIATPTPLFFRLYGVAITALLIGYSFGIPVAEAGHFPWGVVCMGIVSNGGAAIFLFAYSQGNKTNQLLFVFFGLVALALVTAIFLPTIAVQKAW